MRYRLRKLKVQIGWGQAVEALRYERLNGTVRALQQVPGEEKKKKVEGTQS